MRILEKKDMTESAISQINRLFIEGYANYHYKELLTVAGFKKLLKSPEFDCVYIIKDGEVIGFAGYYLFLDETPARVILSHLLLKKSCRGQGIGKLLEKMRLEKVESKVPDLKLVYASCVEKPVYSIVMKLKHNFAVGGLRWRYRRSEVGHDNAIIMVCREYANAFGVLEIDNVNTYTRRLIHLLNDKIVFHAKTSDEICRYDYTKNFFKPADRIVCKLKESKNGKLIEDILQEIQQEEGCYIGFRIDPSIRGMKHIDDCFIKNQFFPLGYIPYANNGYGELEYQLLRKGKEELLEDTSVSEYGKGLLNKIFSDERNDSYE